MIDINHAYKNTDEKYHKECCRRLILQASQYKSPKMRNMHDDLMLTASLHLRICELIVENKKMEHR